MVFCYYLGNQDLSPNMLKKNSLNNLVKQKKYVRILYLPSEIRITLKAN